MNKKRILIVDDEVGFTRVLKLSLEETQAYEVRVENWPEDALGAAREFKPDLVFLDVVMPRMFGGDIAAQLRADPEFQRKPIVFLTAAVRKSGVAAHGGAISGFPFLAKPVSAAEVIACIETHLRS